MEREPDAIGAANFNIALLKTVVDEIKAPIACKIEYHVMLDQTRLRRFLTAKSIPLLACCPVGATACGHQSGARENRPQAQCERRAGSTEMPDRSDGVSAIPKASRAESQQAISTRSGSISMTATGRRSRPCPRTNGV
jgi:2,5-diketo-D-gluconate reductase B